MSDFNLLSQIRPDDNDCQEQLNDSIKNSGLINPLNVAIVPRSLLEEYLAFANETWGDDERKIADFKSIDGSLNWYALLIAGHSRLIGEQQKAKAKEISESDYKVEIQVHPAIETIGDIVELQVAENIHSTPPPDRIARVYAQAFLWEKRANPRLSRETFAARHNLKIKALRDALNYVKLPPEIRELTDKRNGLPFTVAIELARALDPIRQEVRRIAGKNRHETLSPREEETVVFELTRCAQWFEESHGRVLQTRGKIRQHATALRQKDAEQVYQPELDFITETAESHRAVLIGQIRSFLGEFATERAVKAQSLQSYIATLMHRHGELSASELVEATAAPDILSLRAEFV